MRFDARVYGIGTRQVVVANLLMYLTLLLGIYLLLGNGLEIRSAYTSQEGGFLLLSLFVLAPFATLQLLTLYTGYRPHLLVFAHFSAVTAIVIAAYKHYVFRHDLLIDLKLFQLNRFLSYEEALAYLESIPGHELVSSKLADWAQEFRGYEALSKAFYKGLNETLAELARQAAEAARLKAEQLLTAPAVDSVPHS